MQIFLFLSLASVTYSIDEIEFLGDDFIELINTKQNSWVAGRNFPKDTPVEYLRSLACVKSEVDKHNRSYDAQLKTFSPERLPSEFDARSEWPHCESLNDIRDQGKCGSCWAKAAAAVMTDRWCILTNGSFYFSTEDIVTCHFRGGCDGGRPLDAFDFWAAEGVVSGGKADSKEGCKPYTLQHVGVSDPTPECKRECQPGYGIEYDDDKKKAEFTLTFSGEDSMRFAIQGNGAIVAEMDVYKDFFYYKSGVYRHIDGKKIGRHALKVLGWGQENGEDYWLVANSWGTNFGDGGFMKILRGKDEGGIETYGSVTGMPLIHDK